MNKIKINTNSKAFAIATISTSILLLFIVAVISKRDQSIISKPIDEEEKNLSTSPSPVIPTIATTSAIQTEIPKDLSGNTNITVFDNVFYSINEQKQLVQYIQGQPKLISLPGYSVISFQAKNNIVIYETGIYSDPSNNLYIYDQLTEKTTKINTDKLRPVISFAISPDNQSVLFLSNYQANNASANLNVYSTITGNTGFIAFSIRANKVFWADNDNFIVAYKADQTEPNYHFSIYPVNKRQFINKDTPGTEKSVKSGHGFLYYINPIGRTLNKISLTTYQETKVLDKTQLNTEVVPDPYTEFVTLITPKTEVVEISKVNTDKNKITQTKLYKLNTNESYIEPVMVNGDIYLKILDLNTKSYKVVLP